MESGGKRKFRTETIRKSKEDKVCGTGDREDRYILHSDVPSNIVNGSLHHGSQVMHDGPPLSFPTSSASHAQPREIPALCVFRYF